MSPGRGGWGLLLAALCVGCAASRPPLPVLTTGPSSLALPAEAEAHTVQTADGYALSLVRYRGTGPKVGGAPVLLLHGIAANGRNMDLDAEHSLSRWLAAQGRDSWTLSIRGVGRSQRADRAQGRAPGFDFDTLWREDLRAAIAFVRAHAGSERVDFVGHSMGGMLVYAYLSQGGEGLGRVVTLGSPTRLDFGSPVLEAALGLEGLVWKDAMVPSAGLSRLAAPFYGAVEGDPLTLLLMNPENVGPDLWRRFMVTGVDDISGALILQLASLVKRGAFSSADGTIDYRADLSKVQNPVLVVAGKVDRFCPPMAAWDAYRSLGGPRTWLLMSRTGGAQADYGHMDFVLGERASSELWPRILAFLDGERIP